MPCRRYGHGDAPPCGNCHNLSEAHYGTPSQMHVPADVTNCTPCHNASLTFEHNIRTPDAGGAFTCATCHTSTDPLVVAAIAAKNSACAACHTGDHHPGAHSSSVADTPLGATGFTCGQCHQTDLPTEHAKPTSSSFAMSCAACHPAPRNTLTPAWDKTCSQAGCHGTGTAQEIHGAGTAAHTTLPANSGCFGTGCHTGTDLSAIHASAETTVGGVARTSCLVCHADSVPTSRDCTTCHTASPHPTSHDTSGSTECVSCHTDQIDLGGHLDCATCHANPILTENGTRKLKGTFTANCVSCHNATVLGTHSYTTPDPNHYVEATHTATPFTAAAQGTGADGAVAAGGLECSVCHSSTLKTAHATVSTSGGSVTCVECHTNTSLGSASVITGNWANDRCTDCHDTGAAKTHGGYAADHAVSTTRGCAASGSNCHGTATSLVELHASSRTGGDPKYASCANTGCHTAKDARPADIAADSCGTGSAGGCHADKTTTNHGADHGYTSSSDYTQAADTVGSEAGCAGSGSGCHGAVGGSRNAVEEFHAGVTTGCTASDACHTSSTMTSGWKAAGSGADCSRCHAENFVNASDAMPLVDGPAAGHYDEASHTVSAGLGTMSAGGTASAGCSLCHSTTLRNAHGASGTSFSSSTRGAYVTCTECHGYNTSVSALTTDTTRTNNCAACHTAGVIPSSVMHNASSAPVVLSASVSCGFTGIGCHTSLDLHAIHKDASGCLLSGCHEANKDMSTASTNCGEASGCHQSAYYAPTTLIHDGTGGRADSYDADHHTATTTQMDANFTYNSKSAACSACHSAALGTEHARGTSTMSGAGSTSCVKCHNDSATVANVVNSSWPSKNTTGACASCHANTDGTSAATAHGGMAGHASGTQLTGCTGLGAGCHGAAASPDLTNVHATGCALTRACHSTSVYNPASKTCTSASCHPTGYNTTTYAHNTVNGTDPAHAVTAPSMTTTLAAGTGGTTSAACSTCHSSTLKTAHNIAAGFATSSLGWTSECTGCHNATSPIDVAALVAAGNWANTCLSRGCHNTSQQAHVDGGTDAPAAPATEAEGAASCVKAGCHATLDLHALHKGDGIATDPSCASAGCHDAANLDKRPTAKSCGATGACHTSDAHDPTAHTTLASSACTVCHESGDLKAVHGGAASCTTCHGNPNYPTLPTGKLECVSCHTSGVVGTRNYTPADPSHYAGTEASHTASAQTGTVSGFACSTCHSLEMKPEHFKSSTATPTLVGYANVCIGCHEAKADALGTYPAWNKTCDSCHATKHAGTAVTHNFTTGNAGCAGADCHNTSNASAIHSSALPGAGNCTSCHTSNTAPPTKRLCTDCHSAGTFHPATATTHAAADDCIACHATKANIATGTRHLRDVPRRSAPDRLPEEQLHDGLRRLPQRHGDRQLDLRSVRPEPLRGDHAHGRAVHRCGAGRRRRDRRQGVLGVPQRDTQDRSRHHELRCDQLHRVSLQHHAGLDGRCRGQLGIGHVYRVPRLRGQHDA